MNRLGTGYMHLSNYQCEKAINIFKELEDDIVPLAWLFSQTAKAYYERNDYKIVMFY